MKIVLKPFPSPSHRKFRAFLCCWRFIERQFLGRVGFCRNFLFGWNVCFCSLFEKGNRKSALSDQCLFRFILILFPRRYAKLVSEIRGKEALKNSAKKRLIQINDEFPLENSLERLINRFYVRLYTQILLYALFLEEIKSLGSEGIWNRTNI